MLPRLPLKPSREGGVEWQVTHLDVGAGDWGESDVVGNQEMGVEMRLSCATILSIIAFALRREVMMISVCFLQAYVASCFL